MKTHMQIKPFRNRILVKPHENQSILRSEDGSLSEYGEVLAIGPEVQEIKIGDKLGFSVFGVEKLIIEDEKYYFLTEDSEFILAILED